MAFQRKKQEAIGAKAPFPGFIEPELATSIEKLPSGDRWIHEIKFDGYRVQVHLRDAVVKVFTGFPKKRLWMGFSASVGVNLPETRMILIDGQRSWTAWTSLRPSILPGI
jgi:hypothetical protein